MDCLEQCVSTCFLLSHFRTADETISGPLLLGQQVGRPCSRKSLSRARTTSFAVRTTTNDYFNALAHKFVHHSDALHVPSVLHSVKCKIVIPEMFRKCARFIHYVVAPNSLRLRRFLTTCSPSWLESTGLDQN